jgi:hypothetical protein
MKITKFCYCCFSESEFYKSPNYKKSDKYCIKCNTDFDPLTKKKREQSNILKMITSSKEINEECTRL